MSKMSDYLVNQIGTSADYRARLDQNIPEPDNSGDSAPGFFSSLFHNALGGLEGSVGGGLNYLGAFAKSQGGIDPNTGWNSLGDWLINNGEYLNNQADDIQQQYGTLNKYQDETIAQRLTDLDYLTDSRGLTADIFNGLGSSVPFIAASMAAPELGVGGWLARGAGGALERMGAGRLGQAVASDLVQAGANDFTRYALTSGPLEAAVNAGGIYDDLKNQGLSDSEIFSKMNGMIGEELPVDMLTSGLYGAVLGGNTFSRLGQGGWKRAIAANVLNTPADMLGEYMQEMTQQQVQNKYSGKPYGTFFNPTEDEMQAGRAAAMGALPMGMFGSARGIRHSRRAAMGAVDGGSVTGPEPITPPAVPDPDVDPVEAAQLTGKNDDVPTADGVDVTELDPQQYTQWYGDKLKAQGIDVPDATLTVQTPQVKQAAGASNNAKSGASSYDASALEGDPQYTVSGEVSSTDVTPLTDQKMRLLDSAYYKKYGQHLYITSMKRNGDGSSWHDSGQAFDTADDNLANSKEARDWLVSEGEKLGLTPLDEYENPSAHATGGHIHFSDHGDPIPEGATQNTQAQDTQETAGNGNAPAADLSSLPVGDIATAIAQNTGLPANFIWAQLSHESDGGNSKLAREDHNYGGVKGTDGEYLHFDNDQQFIDYMSNYYPKYREDGIYDAQTADQFAEALQHGGYFTADLGEYEGGMHRYLEQAGLSDSGTAGAPAEKQSTVNMMTQQQFGDMLNEKMIDFAGTNDDTVKTVFNDMSTSKDKALVSLFAPYMQDGVFANTAANRTALVNNDGFKKAMAMFLSKHLSDYAPAFENGKISFQQAEDALRPRHQVQAAQTAQAVQATQTPNIKTTASPQAVMQMVNSGLNRAQQQALLKAADTAMHTPQGMANGDEMVFMNRLSQAVTEYDYPTIAQMIPNEAAQALSLSSKTNPPRVKNVMEPAPRTTANTVRTPDVKNAMPSQDTQDTSSIVQTASQPLNVATAPNSPIRPATAEPVNTSVAQTFHGTDAGRMNVPTQVNDDTAPESIVAPQEERRNDIVAPVPQETQATPKAAVAPKADVTPLPRPSEQQGEGVRIAPPQQTIDEQNAQTDARIAEIKKTPLAQRKALGRQYLDTLRQNNVPFSEKKLAEPLMNGNPKAIEHVQRTYGDLLNTITPAEAAAASQHAPRTIQVATTARLGNMVSEITSGNTYKNASPVGKLAYLSAASAHAKTVGADKSARAIDGIIADVRKKAGFSGKGTTEGMTPEQKDEFYNAFYKQSLDDAMAIRKEAADEKPANLKSLDNTIEMFKQELAKSKPTKEERKEDTHESTQGKSQNEPDKGAKNQDQHTKPEPRKTADTQREAEEGEVSTTKKAADNGGKYVLADGYRTESGKPLSEADEKEFILKPDGNKDFGEITDAISKAAKEQSGVDLAPGKICLRVGNDKEGLLHAKKHEGQAKADGYASIEDMIADVAENFDSIYAHGLTGGGHTTYSLIKHGNKATGKMNGVAPVYLNLEDDGHGNYYVIVTAIPKGDANLARQTKKDRLIYSSPGLGAATESNAGAVSTSAKNVGAETRGGTPTSDKSSGSSTHIIPHEQKKGTKNLDTGKVPAMGEPIHGIKGTETTVVTDSGKEIRVRYLVVPASRVITSHNAETMTANKAYPQELQPRDRQRVSMQEQVTTMANELRPADLGAGRNLNQGAPIIRKDGVVLNGNGRAMAIQKATAAGGDKATAYRKYIFEHSKEFGLSRVNLAQVRKYMLVREVVDDIDADTMQDIIGSTAGGSRMGASEQAKADAKKIRPRELIYYVDNEQGDLTTTANQDFVARVLYRIVGKNERNAYTDEHGNVNADGIQRVKRALFSLAYNDNGLIDKMAESTDDNIRNVSRGLMSAAHAFARVNLAVKDGQAYEYDAAKTISDAVKHLDALRREGKPVKDYLNEQSMFSEYQDTDEVREVLRFLDENKRSGKKIGIFLNDMARSVLEQGSPNQTSLMDGGRATLGEIIKAAERVARDGTTAANLFDNVQEESAPAEEIRTQEESDATSDIQNANAASTEDRSVETNPRVLSYKRKAQEIVSSFEKRKVNLTDARQEIKDLMAKANEERWGQKMSNDECMAAQGFLSDALSKLNAKQAKKRKARKSIAKAKAEEKSNESIFGSVEDADKEEHQAALDNVGTYADIDLRDINDINTLFDRMENMVMPERYDASNARKAEPAPTPAVQLNEAQVEGVPGETPNFTADEYEHTKTHEIKFRARPKSYLGDNYRPIQKLAKAHGGYYSKYAKNSFLFEDEDERNAFLQEAEALLSDGKASAKGSVADMVQHIEFPEPSSLTTREKAMQEFGQQMGVKVVFFDGPANLRGFYNKGITFINRSASKSPSWVFWHENLHWLRSNNPELYRQMVDYISGRQEFAPKQLQAYRDAIGRPELTDADTIEEMLADAMPDVHKRVDLFRKMGRENKSLIQRFFGWLRDTMAAFHNAFSQPSYGLSRTQAKAMRNALANIAEDLRDGEGRRIFRTRGADREILTAQGEELSYPTPDDDTRYSADGRDDKPAGSPGMIRRALAKLVDVKTLDNVEVRHAKGKQLDDISGWDMLAKSVRQVARKSPAIQYMYRLGRKALDEQEHLRNFYAQEMKRFNKYVKDPKVLKETAQLLLDGDALGHAYTGDELEAMGVSAEAGRAYNLARKLLADAFKRVNDARMQVSVRTKIVGRNDYATFLSSHFLKPEDILKTDMLHNGSLRVTYRGAKVYEKKDVTVSPAEFNNLSKDKDVYITYDVQNNDGTHTIGYTERVKPINNLEGYMPHFFHKFMVYEKTTGDDGKEILVSLGSANSLKKAADLANKYAADNPNGQFVIRPHSFEYDENYNNVVVGDKDYTKMMLQITKHTEMTLPEANKFLHDNVGVTKKNRHRFFGNAMHRKGAKGFDKDVQWALTHYLNASARYVAMEHFKPEAIGFYERFFGDLNAEPKSNTARYIKNYINDMNGVPSYIEQELNKIVDHIPILGARLSDAFEGRPALALSSSISWFNAVTKLGLGNFASAAINFMQFVNIGTRLNSYVYANAGLKKAIHLSDADRRIIDESGVLDEVNLSSDAGGYTQRRDYGRVRSGFGKVKRGLDYMMIPFTKADTLMREAAILGAYYQGIKEMHMSHEKALAYAKDVNFDANFDYSTAAAPGAMRAGSVLTQQLFQFQKYPIMQFEFFWNNVVHAKDNKQRARFLVPYLLLSGAVGAVPFGGLINALASTLAGVGGDDDNDLAEEIKAEMMKWAGTDPIKRRLVNTVLYGILANANINISERVGMSNAFSGEYYGNKPQSSAGALVQLFGGPLVSTIYNVAKQAANHNPIETIKAVSPSLGNILQAIVGETRTTHHRVGTVYEDAYSRVMHALGFRSVDETNNSFVNSYLYNQQKQEREDRKDAMDAYIRNPSSENHQRMVDLGIKDSTFKTYKDNANKSSKERSQGEKKTKSKKPQTASQKEDERLKGFTK